MEAQNIQPVQEETLQAIIRRWQNRETREYFSDFGVDENWSPDLTTHRGILAKALLHEDEDPYMVTLLKCWFLEHIRSQAYRVPYYGIPVSSFQESRKFRPQVALFFQEDLADVEPGYPPVTGEISFRLMDHTTETITPTIAGTFANRIRTAFGVGGPGYVWRKGKDMATYNDWGKGYALQILTRSESEAREVISKVLDVQNDTPDWSKMNYSQNEAPMEAFPTIPGNDFIFGQTRRRPRKRPIASVRFQTALLHVHGLPNPVVLYDRSGVHPTALETG
ncbi:hypothetical protein [Phormidium sp. FACHB-1136]|uniref:hypothetical protein n=1 Tax=Phormidium sp. FACHB-1136 TaxID=2692848 RepID=UPI00168477E0|nr:hypothetical protein [Phormidium sp. FACHB-1136]MBD2425261.1 hypothetical protein [Phormidium sp. FACHB-1136]